MDTWERPRNPQLFRQQERDRPTTLAYGARGQLGNLGRTTRQDRAKQRNLRAGDPAPPRIYSPVLRLGLIRTSLGAEIPDPVRPLEPAGRKCEEPHRDRWRAAIRGRRIEGQALLTVRDPVRHVQLLDRPELAIAQVGAVALAAAQHMVPGWVEPSYSTGLLDRHCSIAASLNPAPA
jgi:hypothetical protein